VITKTQTEPATLESHATLTVLLPKTTPLDLFHIKKLQ